MKGATVGFIVLIFLLVIAFIPWLLMTCWNYVIPYVFHLPVIDFWQAWALMVVFGILTGSVFRFRSSSKD